MSRHLVRLRRRGAALPVAALIAASFAGPSASAQAVSTVAIDALARQTGSTLAYGTYFGGSGLYENVTSVATDSSGDVFIGGVTDGEIPATVGVVQDEMQGGGDGFIAKLDDAGGLVWATYLGGSHSDTVNDIVVGTDGSVFVVGTTLSGDFPTTPGAAQTEFKGQNTGCDPHCVSDAFVAKLSSDGSRLTYSTYLGGGGSEGGNAIEVTSSGAAIVAGETSSSDFPATQDSFDPSYNMPTCFDMCEADVFVAELDPAGTHLRQATYFGGTSWDSAADIALDSEGNVYVAGSTRSTDLPTTSGAFQTTKNGKEDFDFSGFVTALSSDLGAARYATYLGARSEEHISGLTVDGADRAWVTGFGGRGIPVTPDAMQRDLRGASDAFITGLTSDGTALVYSSRFGGSREDYGRAIELDGRGRVHVGGSTASPDMKTRGAFQPANAGFDDLFYLRFKPGASRPQRATYIGGSRFETATDLALTTAGSAYLVGASESRDMPLAGRFLQPNLARNDGVLMRVDDGSLVHAKVDDGGFWQPRMRPHLGKTVKYHFANTNERSNRLVESSVGLFDTKRRRPGAEFYVTFPAGRFTVSHPRGNVMQRVSVAPVATYAVQGSGVEVRWARFPLGEGISFDVQVKVDAGSWETWLTHTDQIGAIYPGGTANYLFRARVHNAGAEMTSAWSPPVLLSEPS